MKPGHILSLTKKELRSYFDSPTAYVALLIFLLLWEFLFFRNVFLVGESSLRLLLNYLPWLFLILVPALTMGSIASEKALGTLELVLTHPITALELILGKFLAATGFLAVALLFILPIAYGFDQFGVIDWGEIAGQYFASLLLGSLLIALGIFISSLFSNQISSLLLSAAASFGIIIIGSEIVTLSLPGPIAPIFERLSALTHFESMSRGVIDLRDLIYFASGIAIFLALAYLQILKIRLGNQKQAYQQQIMGIALFVGISIMINIVGARIPGRLDLTQEQTYVLSDATHQTLADLEDVVSIKLFATGDSLPAQLRPVLRDIKDTLRDYQTASAGNINLSIEDPSKDDSIVAQARQLGIREVQFNVVGQEELQLKRGYLGLAILYEGETEIIPLINDASGLEYQLTSLITKLTTKEPKHVAFLTGHGEKNRQGQYLTWSSELEKTHQLQDLTLTPDEPIPQDISTLIVAGPSQEFPQEERQQLADYIDSGGSVLFLIDSVIVNDAILSANVNENSLIDFLTTYGINVGLDIVYDVRSSETVNFGVGQGVNYVLQYPFWPRALATDKSSQITSQLDGLVLIWPASVNLDSTLLNQKGLEGKSLFATTQFGSAQTGVFNITPDQDFIPSNPKSIPLVASLIGQETQDAKVPRLLVVGDSDFITDQFVANSSENLAFGVEAVNWLSQSQSLAEIQLKGRTARRFLFNNETQPAIIKYANMGLAVVAVAGFGLFRFYRRRSLSKFQYSSSS